ncbi:hypothetical protein B0H19DRAFT_994589 [Mycena capillaripes]|nr:hypothetical protein B0H19DRAFT_994589 [Mycena capillaripes]
MVRCSTSVAKRWLREPEVEPEVDLSSFVERQRISDARWHRPPIPANATEGADCDDDDHVFERNKASHVSQGEGRQIEWDEGLDELDRKKASAEAIRDLKSRFRAKSEKLRKSATAIPHPSTSSSIVAAPLLPLCLPNGSVAQPPPKGPKEDIQDFLGDLLS